MKHTEFMALAHERDVKAYQMIGAVDSIVWMLENGHMSQESAIKRFKELLAEYNAISTKMHLPPLVHSVDWEVPNV